MICKSDPNLNLNAKYKSGSESSVWDMYIIMYVIINNCIPVAFTAESMYFMTLFIQIAFLDRYCCSHLRLYGQIIGTYQ